MEIRDPIYSFIRLSNDEKKVLNSKPVQRLRYIHQLALTYLVYPGATHKRFEHSLGVMELAGRVFDIITRKDNINDEIRSVIPEIDDKTNLDYWERVLRMAALCHDLGHLPFSHAAEKELLPENWNHEILTQKIIRSEEMKKIWYEMTPPLRVDDIVKLAVGPHKIEQEKRKDLLFSDWETILSEIIVGDSFGVDRMDYLLRDSHHLGVAYGKFDHHRLIDTLRILKSTAYKGDDTSKELSLGIEEGGIHVAESLLMARYFIFTQVYLHHVRRIYDIHLKDFLKEWLSKGTFSTKIEDHLSMTDVEVLLAIREAAKDENAKGFKDAQRILSRNHFRLLYQRNPKDYEKNPESVNIIYEAAKVKFDLDNVRLDKHSEKERSTGFPVMQHDGRISDSNSTSDVIRRLPYYNIEYILVIIPSNGLGVIMILLKKHQQHTRRPKDGTIFILSEIQYRTQVF